MNNATQTGCFDKETINIHEYYEVEHWTKELHTTVENLRKAVCRVGTSINDIKTYLSSK